MPCPPRSFMPRRLIEQRALPGDRPVVLGVETIFARDQHILDEWWRREIDDSELRQRIRFDLDWGYDWTPFHELLVTARDHARSRLRSRLHAARRPAQNRRARSPCRRKNRGDPATPSQCRNLCLVR